MSMEENKAIVRRFHEEAWNRGIVDVMDELYAPDCLSNGSPVLPGTKNAIREYRRTMPDLKVMIEDLIAEGDKVVTRWTMTGTNSGKPISYTGITIQRLRDGKIVDEFFVAQP